MSMIIWKRRHISFYRYLEHLGLSYNFIRCPYSWYFIVYSHMTKFMCPGWIFKLPVIPFVIYQSSLVWCTYVSGEDWGGIGMGIVMVITLFTMKLCHCRRLSIVLYFCTGVTWMGLPSYWFVALGMISVSSGMTWRAFWGGLRENLSGAIVIVSMLPILRNCSGDGYVESILVVCCVGATLCCGSGACYTLGSWTGGGLVIS